MAREARGDEVKQQYLAAMGPELGSLFHGLWNECLWLNLLWREHAVLFGTTRERIELLNKAAPSFFRLVEDVLWESVLLRICRLTDPPKSAGRENLTVQRVVPMVAVDIRPTVDTLLQEAKRKCEFARDWRNRRIAHRELHPALRESAAPLAPASHRAVHEAIASIGTLLNAVELHYRDTTVEYDAFTEPPGDAEDLLCVLTDGVEAEAQRRNRLVSGQPSPEDLRPRPAV